MLPSMRLGYARVCNDYREYRLWRAANLQETEVDHGKS